MNLTMQQIQHNIQDQSKTLKLNPCPAWRILTEASLMCREASLPLTQPGFWINSLRGNKTQSDILCVKCKSWQTSTQQSVSAVLSRPEAT